MSRKKQFKNVFVACLNTLHPFYWIQGFTAGLYNLSTPNVMKVRKIGFKVSLQDCTILKSTLNCLYASVKPPKWVPTHERHCVELNIANLEPILANTPSSLFLHST